MKTKRSKKTQDTARIALRTRLAVLRKVEGFRVLGFRVALRNFADLGLK